MEKFVEKKPFPPPPVALRVPKVFGLENRRVLGDKSGPLMETSNLDYHDLATKIVDLFGKKYLVYPNLNVQCRITRLCDSLCEFCIEHFDDCVLMESTDEVLAERLGHVFQEFMLSDVFPSCTITGGEPVLLPKRLKAILNKLKEIGVHKYNLDTNGSRIDDELGAFLAQNELPYLNISLHHWDPAINRAIFKNRNAIGMNQVSEILKRVGGGTYGKTPRVRLQCVLLEGYVDSISSIEEYIQRAIDAGVDNIAFRGLSDLSHGQYNQNRVSMAKLLDNLATSANCDWRFICQNVADWYVYEDWLYKGVDVHLNFSNMDFLRQFESLERQSGKQYGREFVVFEDAAFAGSWNRDFSLILPGQSRK